ncbi:hypothetical protein CQW23_22950 [Capsicum baccatum]|uniref:F-box domain-containing protein n=1 Tax=Capsicum baccatum TaxID=33114 RepID=A0A2G2W2A8_CAPBA|nr:hypothetical protein CQW23_22950 [Capsicum baccatum]
MAKKKLQKALEHDTCVLPSEILFSILVRLPVQSLLRFRSVYKPWKIMISDKEFIKAHRDQTKALGREKLLTKKVGVSNYVFRDLESHQVLVSMDAKQLFPNEKFQGGSLVCSCDGLVLLKHLTYTYKYYGLWNPFTREYRLLKCSDDVKFREDPPNACGRPAPGKELVDEFNVLEANLWNDVSLNKGSEASISIVMLLSDGSMELMVVPNKKVFPHKRGIRNGPKSLNPFQ